MEQRYVPLSFTANGGAVNATSPANANVAPPGVYMLFVIGTGGVPSVAEMVRVGTPTTTVTGGPSAGTNDPTPTFTFSSANPSASFECKLDSGSFAPCASPKTTPHLADGPHTFSVRARDSAGNVDPTPALRTFTVRTASVGVSGATLVVTAAPGAKDNLAITRPSASTLRVTDFPSGAYTGSGVHTGAGCTRTGDYTADCSSAGINLIQVSSGDQADKVVNSNAVKSSLGGGAANDALTGGSNKDTLTGGAGVDVLKGLAGGDLLKARDAASDALIGCGAGTDKTDLDLLPKDPNSVVKGCETKTRR
jgi:Ca2+-binding RTX toxin-like protein